MATFETERRTEEKQSHPPDSILL